MVRNDPRTSLKDSRPVKMRFSVFLARRWAIRENRAFSHSVHGASEVDNFEDQKSQNEPVNFSEKKKVPKESFKVTVAHSGIA